MKVLFALLVLNFSLTAFAGNDVVVATCGLNIQFLEVNPGHLGISHKVKVVSEDAIFDARNISITGNDMNIEYVNQQNERDVMELSFDRPLGKIKKKFSVLLTRSVREENGMTMVQDLNCRMKKN